MQNNTNDQSPCAQPTSSSMQENYVGNSNEAMIVYHIRGALSLSVIFVNFHPKLSEIIRQFSLLNLLLNPSCVPCLNCAGNGSFVPVTGIASTVSLPTAPLCLPSNASSRVALSPGNHTEVISPTQFLTIIVFQPWNCQESLQVSKGSTRSDKCVNLQSVTASPAAGVLQGGPVCRSDPFQPLRTHKDIKELLKGK